MTWQVHKEATYLPCICTNCGKKAWKWMYRLPGEGTCVCSGHYVAQVLDTIEAVAVLANEGKEPDQ